MLRIQTLNYSQYLINWFLSLLFLRYKFGRQGRLKFMFYFSTASPFLVPHQLTALYFSDLSLWRSLSGTFQCMWNEYKKSLCPVLAIPQLEYCNTSSTARLFPPNTLLDKYTIISVKNATLDPMRHTQSRAKIPEILVRSAHYNYYLSLWWCATISRMKKNAYCLLLH